MGRQSLQADMDSLERMVVEFAKDKPAQISVPMKIKNEELRLMASARTGAVTDTYLESVMNFW